MTTATKQIHTPGPWRTDWLNRREGRIVRGDGLVCIAELPLWREEFKEELDANARLIASAPEMLEALIMIHRIMIQRDMAEDEQRVSDQAWAAIQKARGIK